MIFVCPIPQSQCCGLRHRSLVERRLWAADLAHPKILAWRPLCVGARHSAKIASSCLLLLSPTLLANSNYPESVSVGNGTTEVPLADFCCVGSLSLRDFSGDIVASI